MSADAIAHPVRVAILRALLRVIAILIVAPVVALLVGIIVRFPSIYASMAESLPPRGIPVLLIALLAFAQSIGVLIGVFFLLGGQYFPGVAIYAWLCALPFGWIYAGLLELPVLRDSGRAVRVCLGVAAGALTSAVVVAYVSALPPGLAALAGAIGGGLVAWMSEPIVLRLMPAGLRGAGHVEHTVACAWRALAAAWSATVHCCDDWAPGARLSGLFAAIAVAATVLAVGAWSTTAASEDPVGALMLPALVALPVALLARRFAQAQHAEVPRGARTTYLFALGSIAVALPVAWIVSLGP